MDIRSSSKDLEVPEKIKKFNFGACFFNIFWGIENGVWLSFLTLIPVIGWFVMPIVLGFKGNEWAWRKNNYSSAESFLASQNKWARSIAMKLVLIIIIFALIIFLPILGIVHFTKRGYQSAVTSTITLLKQNDDIVEYLGDEITESDTDGSIFKNGFSYKYDSAGEEVKIVLDVKGQKNSATVDTHYRIMPNKKLLIEKLVVYTEDGKVIFDNAKEYFLNKDIIWI